jgi:hypothetical protein
VTTAVVRAGTERRIVVALGFVVFAVARVSALASYPLRFDDSASYEHLRVGGLRLPMVPLVYSIVGSDGARMVAQVAVGIGCWCAAAWLIGRLAGGDVGLVAGGVVLLVGLAPSVVMWDSAILSESLSISLLVLTVGLWLNVRECPAMFPYAVWLSSSSLAGQPPAERYCSRWRSTSPGGSVVPTSRSTTRPRSPNAPESRRLTIRSTSPLTRSRS